MQRLEVECLQCGKHRKLARRPWRCTDESACPRCSYVGWAPADDLTERARRVLRDRTIEDRAHLRVA